MYNHNLFTRQSIGKLMVYVFGGDKVKPIIGAKVSITGHNQNVTLETNESGQTQTVELPAGEPYFEYSVNVSAIGYNSVKLKGVQVVPNTTGIQEIQMTLSIQTGNDSSTEEYNIPPHKLTQPEAIKPVIDSIAIPDPKPKPLPHPQSLSDGPPIGLLIPEYIIVHCGAPQEPAPKYKVKFTDYITKVACAEIHPAWHPEALKANILCITSNILNKIFTQAYSGFDVTCLRQFDFRYNHFSNNL